MRRRFRGVGQDGRALPVEVLAEQMADAGILDPVAAAHHGRLEAPRHLVLAAGPRLEGGKAFAQALVDALL